MNNHQLTLPIEAHPLGINDRHKKEEHLLLFFVSHLDAAVWQHLTQTKNRRFDASTTERKRRPIAATRGVSLVQ